MASSSRTVLVFAMEVEGEVFYLKGCKVGFEKVFRRDVLRDVKGDAMKYIGFWLP